MLRLNKVILEVFFLFQIPYRHANFLFSVIRGETCHLKGAKCKFHSPSKNFSKTKSPLFCAFFMISKENLPARQTYQTYTRKIKDYQPKRCRSEQKGVKVNKTISAGPEIRSGEV
eukprot:Pompholyxophrys_punicea_v1_NODE_357_length_2166_cov_19.413548.p3 type:complete len:115 gc:universal NODE_357_length_2166_cov_19.413548:1646-1302(-)